MDLSNALMSPNNDLSGTTWCLYNNSCRLSIGGIVAVAGATGNTGSSILNALLKTPELFQVTALSRPTSVEKPELIDFAKRGVTVKAVELDGSIEAISGVLVNVDVVISCLTLFSFQEEMNLIEASSKANVGVMMLGDKVSIRQTKEFELNWYQLTLPALPSGRFRPMVEEYSTTHIIGDGNTPWTLTNNRDIGNFVSRIIADQKTLNKMVFAYGEVMTKNEAFDILEKVSGETVTREVITKEEVQGVISQGHTGKGRTVNPKVGMAECRNLLGIRGENTPEYAHYLGYLDARELYPDVKFTSFEKYIGVIMQTE
ncbi:hypothetical protein BDP55DRAFT_688882 [Colletotrichum godetiae]|uniref:NmrA-like domain-containing protein n=1 Tax=Colletotrichum godetiae TaxID=1209918 RepID=A0AAJ0AZ30_9PEZI|nr:uncharacterized protein BDP55DRAFT_688882 [Colletotrichum godetiae]KAK1700865.1 hypothetical protein BDP55DRAFT_688882 [Colletotrichum godetiae]